MASLCLSSSRIVSLLNQKPFLSLKLRPLISDPTVLSRETAAIRYSSLSTLMLARGTGIHKSFVVPLFALTAPLDIISWAKGEYGIWTAFVALLTRLFFSFPGELELPFIALLMVIVAPYQVMSIRGKQEGAIISLVISCFLAFQHFSRAGSLQKAFDQSSIVATLGIIAVTIVSFLLLI